MLIKPKSILGKIKKYITRLSRRIINLLVPHRSPQKFIIKRKRKKAIRQGKKK